MQVDRKRITNMFCSNCGEKLDLNVNFCHKCGHKLNSNNVVSNPPQEEEKEYISKFEGEKVLFSIYGLNKPSFRVFPNINDSIDVVTKEVCDVIFTDKRMCLLSTNGNIKSPSISDVFIPIGGLVGFATASLLNAAIDKYKNSKHKKNIEAEPTALEIDILCLQGKGIYSVGELDIEIFKEKNTFFNTVGNDRKYFHISFTGNYQYKDEIIRGSIIHIFAGPVKETADLLRKNISSKVTITDMYRDEVKNLQYLRNKLS